MFQVGQKVKSKKVGARRAFIGVITEERHNGTLSHRKFSAFPQTYYLVRDVAGELWIRDKTELEACGVSQGNRKLIGAE